MEYQPQKGSCAIGRGYFDRKEEIEKVERGVEVSSSEGLEPLSSVQGLR